jgi:hypothetical protein
MKDEFKLVLVHVASGIPGAFYRQDGAEAETDDWTEATLYHSEQAADAAKAVLAAPEGSEWRVQHRIVD